MSSNPFESVYKIEGVYADPYSVAKVIKNASEKDKAKVVKAAKESGLDSNPNVLKEIQKYEHLRDMSS